MKPNNKHTPGPWKVEKYPYDKIFICRKRGIKNSVIAEIGNNFENENNNANATLIAAAPEMLEVLQLVGTIANISIELSDADYKNRMNRISKLATNIINKAKGE